MAYTEKDIARRRIELQHAANSDSFKYQKPDVSAPVNRGSSPSSTQKKSSTPSGKYTEESVARRRQELQRGGENKFAYKGPDLSVIPAPKINPFEHMQYSDPVTQKFHQRTGWRDPGAQALYELAENAQNPQRKITPAAVFKTGPLVDAATGPRSRSIEAERKAEAASRDAADQTRAGIRFDRNEAVKRQMSNQTDFPGQPDNKAQTLEAYDRKAAEQWDGGIPDDSLLGWAANKLGIDTRKDSPTVGEMMHEYMNDPNQNKTYDAETVQEYNRIYDEQGPGAAQMYVISKSNTEHPGMERIDAFLTGVGSGSGINSLIGGQFGAGNYRKLVAEQQRLAEEHPVASAAGNITGTIGLMSGISSGIGAGAKALAGGTEALRALPTAGKVALNLGSSALTYAATTAAQEAAAASHGLVKEEDYLKNIGVSGGTGLAATAVQLATLGGIEKILSKAGVGGQYVFADYLKNLAGATAAAGTRVGIDYSVADKMPSKAFVADYTQRHPEATEDDVQKAYSNSLKKRAAEQFAVSFIFALINSYESMLRNTETGHGNLQNEYERFEREMEAMYKNPPSSAEEVASWEQSFHDKTNEFRNSVTSGYYAGQQDKVDKILSLLDELDGRAANWAGGFSGTADPGMAGAAGNAGNPAGTPSTAMVAFVDRAMKEGAAAGTGTPLLKVGALSDNSPESAPIVGANAFPGPAGAGQIPPANDVAPENPVSGEEGLRLLAENAGAENIPGNPYAPRTVDQQLTAAARDMMQPAASTEPAELVPVNENTDVINGSIDAPSTTPSTASTIPSTAAAPQQTGEAQLRALAQNAGQQLTAQKEAQRQAIVEVGRNLDADNLAAAMDGATMLTEAEKQAAFQEGKTNAVAQMRMEAGNVGEEAGYNLPGGGSGRPVSLSTGGRTGGIQPASGVLEESSWRAGKEAADPESAGLRFAGEVSATSFFPEAKAGQVIHPVSGGSTTATRGCLSVLNGVGVKNEDIVLFGSDEAILTTGGKRVRASTNFGTGKINIRANDPRATADQLGGHEACEFGVRKGQIVIPDAMNHLKGSLQNIGLSAADADDIISAVVDPYLDIDLDDPRIPTDRKMAAVYAANKEMVCDCGGTINQFADKKGYEKQAALMQIVKDILFPYCNEKLGGALNALVEDGAPGRIVGAEPKAVITDKDISVDGIIPTITEMPKESQVYSTTLYREPAQKELITLTKDGDITVKERLNMSGRDFLIKQMKEKGYKDKKHTLYMLDKTAEFMDKAGTIYKFIGLDDLNNVRLVIDPRSGNIVLRALVKNGEYPVNIDLTKECTRRIALGNFIKYLAEHEGRHGGKTMLEEVPLTAQNLVRFNQILKDEGFDTACLGCFVETRRYRIQEWADSFIEKYNGAVEKYNPEAGYFDFSDKDMFVSDMSKKELSELNEALESYKATQQADKQAKRERLGKPRANLTNEENIDALVRSAKAYQKKLRVSDLITPEGRTALHRDLPELESLVLGHYGSNTPKSVELFTPYNYDLGSILAVGSQTLQDYVKPIAGAREQSFSDSVPTHLMDQMEKTADMAVNHLLDHIYTKVPSEVLMFGLTGRKFNMSIMFNIDPDVDSAHAGLRADGSYFIGDRKTAELEARAGRERTFVQSFPYDLAKKIQNTPGYSKNCGMIGVGYSYFHMKKMMADPDFGYLIGYHPSGMNEDLANMAHITKATSYEPVQNTLKITGLRHVTGDLNGLPSYASWPIGTKTTQNKMVEKTNITMQDFDMKGNLKKYGGPETMKRFLRWLEDNRLTVDTGKATYKGKEQHGVGSFPLYEDLAKTKDPRKTADNYIAWCLENDMLPEFFEFADDPNYFKNIYDFTTYDHRTMKYSPQVPVTMTFPENFFKLANHSLNQWNNYMMRQAPKEGPTFERMYEEAIVHSSSLDLDPSNNKSDKEYLDSVDPDVLAFAQKAANKTLDKHDRVLINKVLPKRLSADIKKLLGFSVEGFGSELNANEATHIWNRHGANGKKDQSMKDLNDIARIGYIENNYDKIRTLEPTSTYTNRDNSLAKQIQLQKAIGGGYYYVVEAVPDTNIKKLRVITAFINKEDTFPEAVLPEGQDQNVRNGLPSNVSSDDNIIPDDTLLVKPEENSTILYLNENAITLSDREEKLMEQISGSYITQIQKVTAEKDAEIADLKQKMDAAVGAEREKWKARIDKLRDEKNRKIAYLEKSYRQNLDWQIATMKQKMDAAVGEEKVKARNRLERLRAQKNEKIDKIIAGYRQQKEEARAKRADRKVRVEFQKKALKALKESRNKPGLASERVQELLKDIDLKSLGMRDDTKWAMRQKYQEILKMKEEDPNYAALFADRDMKKIERLFQKQIKDMDIEELNDLITELSALIHYQETTDKLLKDEQGRSAAEAGRQIVKDLKELTPLDITNPVKRLTAKFLRDNLSPERAFRRISGYKHGSTMEMLYRNILDGMTAVKKFEQKSDELFKPFRDDKKNADFLKNGSKQTIKVMDSYGRTAMISPAMRVSLYMASKNRDNLMHIATDGLTVPDPKLYEKGMILDAYGRGKTLILQPTEVEEICKGMTESEKAFADLLVTFFDGYAKDAINDTSVTLDGILRATVDNYFPIASDRNYLARSMDATFQDPTLEGWNNLKKRQEGANNKILLEDARKVLQRHIKNTARYAGLAVPLRDFNKVYGYTSGRNEDDGTRSSVQRAIHDAWDDDTAKYIERLIQEDINAGGRKAERGVLDAMRSLYAGSTLTLNLGVALKQTTSYAMAGSILDTESLMYGLAHRFTKEDQAYMDSITPWGWTRRQGQSTIELGDMAKRQDPITRNTPNWNQAMDVWTTNRLFLATEKSVQKDYPGLKRGDKEYDEALAERYNQVLWRTQPQYEAAFRPEFLRRTDVGSRIFGQFKTESMQMSGELIDSWGQWKADEHRAKKGNEEAKKQKAESAKQFYRTFASWVASNMMFAILGTAINIAVYHKGKMYRNERGEIDFETLAKKTGINFVGSSLGGFFFASTAFDFGSYLYNAIAGEKATWYDIEAPGLSLINDMVSNMGNWVAVMRDDEASPKARAQATAKLGLAASKFTPLGFAENLVKLADSVNLYIQDVDAGMLWSYEAGEGFLKDTSPTKEQYARQAVYYAGEDDTARVQRALKKTNKDNLEKALGVKITKNLWDSFMDDPENLSKYLEVKTEGHTPKISDVPDYGYSSFEELKKAIGDPVRTQHWHHIVEQEQGPGDKNFGTFTSMQINNKNNIVSVPSGSKSPHQAISTYYGTVQDFTDGKTVREWLSTKSFEEQFNFGVKQLQEYGDIIPTDKGWVFVPDDEKIESKIPLTKGNASEKSEMQKSWESKLMKARADGGLSGKEIRQAALDMMNEGTPQDEVISLYKTRATKDKNIDSWVKSGGDLDDYFGFLDVNPEGQQATADWMNGNSSLSYEEKWALWQLAGWSEKNYDKLIE